MPFLPQRSCSSGGRHELLRRVLVPRTEPSLTSALCRLAGGTWLSAQASPRALSIVFANLADQVGSEGCDRGGNELGSPTCSSARPASCDPAAPASAKNSAR